MSLVTLDSSKFQYKPGTTYEYDYEAQTQTSMSGASEDQASIRITAKAKVEVLSKCEFALKVLLAYFNLVFLVKDAKEVVNRQVV